MAISSPSSVLYLQRCYHSAKLWIWDSSDVSQHLRTRYCPCISNVGNSSPHPLQRTWYRIFHYVWLAQRQQAFSPFNRDGHLHICRVHRTLCLPILGAVLSGQHGNSGVIFRHVWLLRWWLFSYMGRHAQSNGARCSSEKRGYRYRHDIRSTKWCEGHRICQWWACRCTLAQDRCIELARWSRIRHDLWTLDHFYRLVNNLWCLGFTVEMEGRLAVYYFENGNKMSSKED